MTWDIIPMIAEYPIDNIVSPKFSLLYKNVYRYNDMKTIYCQSFSSDIKRLSSKIVTSCQSVFERTYLKNYVVSSLSISREISFHLRHKNCPYNIFYFLFRFSS